jgi:2-dehydropantoate 2-reductase
MNILVVGAGAIGAWLGATLASGRGGRSGECVTVIDRAALVDVVRAQGLTVHLPNGESTVARDLYAASSLDEAVGAAPAPFAPPYDSVICCVKAYRVDQVVRELQAQRERICAARTQFMVMQNGVGSEERFAEVFGPGRVVAATTTSPLSVLAPGVVRVARAGGVMALAQMPPAARSELVPLSAALRRSGLPVRHYEDYRALKWSKLLLNIMGNASSAILDMPVADIYADARLFRWEMRMLREAIAVMRALGVRPVNLPHFPAATLAWAVRLLPDALLRPVLQRRLAGGRGDKRPSFYYDLVNKSGKSEVIYLNGAVAEHGQRLVISTPVNARLTEVLMSLVTGAAQPEDWRGQGERLLSTDSGSELSG